MAGILALTTVAGRFLIRTAKLRPKATEPSIETLVFSAPSTRQFLGRLKGFPYRRYETAAGPRGGKATASGVSRLAGGPEISDRAARKTSAGQLRVLGLSSLLTKRWAAAVATLESAVERQTGESDTAKAIQKSIDVALLNDLSVAYLALATHEAQWSRLVASIECAEKAWGRSHTPEAAWNRAIAFETLHLDAQARAAWTEYLKIDGGSSWAAEASIHLSDLGRKRPVQHTRSSGACASADASVKKAERELFPQWARAVMQHDLARAGNVLQAIGRVGESAVQCTGDGSLAEAVRLATGSGPDEQNLLARAHIDFQGAAQLYESGDYRGAERQLRHAEQVFAELADPFRWYAMSLLAGCAYYQNEFVSADAVASRVIDGPTAEIGRRVLARAYWTRGSSRGARGLVYEAIADYEAAGRIFTATNDAEGALGIETMLAGQYETAGEFAEAWKHRIAALDLASRSSPTAQFSLLLLQMARGAIRDGQWTAAQSFLDEQLAASRDHPEWSDLRVRALLMRAEIEQRLEQDEAARSDRRQSFALALSIRSPDVRFFTTTSADFVRARAAEGIDDRAEIGSAVQYARAHGHKIRLAELLMLTAKALQQRGDIPGARRSVEEALREVASQGAGIRTAKGRDAFFESRSQIYSSAMGLALDQRDAEWAFQISELSLGSSLVSLEAIQRDLPSRMAVVKFAVLPDRLLIWSILRGRTSFSEQRVSAAQLGSTVRDFVARLRDAEDLPDDDDVYALLVTPWLNEAAGVDTIVFVTEGDVTNVPFSVLHGSAHPLLETFAIAYAPSVGAFLASDSARSSPAASAVIAAPAADASGFSALPEASAEARRLAKLYGGATLLASHDATRNRFIAALRDATLVHFAGHAVPNEGNPALSALLLSDDRGAPAYIYAHEIAALPLRRLELVVLAACSTASVPRGRRSGLASLAYAFSFAGAHSVIGTLWPIDDEMGAHFSVGLHRRLHQGMRPAAAIREIQLESMHRIPPRDWAAFVAVGRLDGI